MLEKLKRTSFKFKIMATYIIGLIVIGTAGYTYFLYNLLESNKIQLENKRTELIQHYKDMAKTAIEVAQNMIITAENLATEGITSKKEVEKTALESLNTIKYGMTGYVWCIKDDGTILLDPIEPELVGKNIYKLNIIPHKTLKKAIEKFRLSNLSCIEYDWFYPDRENKLYKKIACVKYIPSLHWIIGSGFYLKEIDNQIELLGKTLKKKAYRSFLKSLIPGIVSSFVSLLILYLLLDKMFKSIEDVAKIPERLIRENITLDMKLPVLTDGPVGKLIENTNKYIEHILRMVKFKESLDFADSELDILELIRQLMEKDFFIKNYAVYQITDSKVIKIVQKGSIPCDNFGKCLKASEKGIKTENFCNGYMYFCIPIVSSGNLVAIVEFSIKENECDLSKIATLEKLFQSAAPNINIKQLTEKLKQKTVHDNLTGLYNRWFLDETIEALTSNAQRHNTKIGFAMIDIDDFKKVNDTFGHTVGDRVLKVVSDALKEHFKRKSDILIRYGGEEFLVITQETEEETFVELLERFRKEVEEKKIKINGKQIGVTVSVGYSIVPKDTENVKEAIELADIALYCAKRNGKNKTVKYSEEVVNNE